MSGRPLLQLYTTMHEFEELHARHDRTHSTSKTITVERQALIHILMDHARMLEALRKVGRVDIAEPSEQIIGAEDRNSRSSRSGPPRR